MTIRALFLKCRRLVAAHVFSFFLDGFTAPDPDRPREQGVPVQRRGKARREDHLLRHPQGPVLRAARHQRGGQELSPLDTVG